MIIIKIILVRVVFILLGLFSLNVIYAQEGPNSSSNVTNGGNGQINAFWSNPNLGRVQDDRYSSLTTSIKGKRTNYIKAQDFGFNIPAGATINGVLVEIERYCNISSGGNVIDDRVFLINEKNEIIGNNKSTAIQWPISDNDNYQSYGGSSDQWGISWNPDKINNQNFGIVYAAKTSNTNNATFNLFIDHIRITIYYTQGNNQRYAIKSGRWSDSQNWATSPNGTPGASAPTVSNDVFIGGGYTIINDQKSECNSLTIGTAEATPAGKLEFGNADKRLIVSGSLIISSNGDVIGNRSALLAVEGNLILNKKLTNKFFKLDLTTNKGSTISGKGTVGILRVNGSRTNTGEITITSLLSGSDNKLINGNTGKITISGVVNSLIDCSKSGNIIKFAHSTSVGTFDISKVGNSFNNVIISGNGIKKFSKNVTINGYLRINPDGVLSNVDNQKITLKGNWTNSNGSAGFIPGTNSNSSVIFSGNNQQRILNVNGEDFFNLEISKSNNSILTAENDLQVRNKLTISSGVFNLLENSLSGTGELKCTGGELRLAKLSTILPQMTGIYNLSGGKIVFAGLGDQKINSALAYANIQFSGNGVKSLTGVLDINGNLIIDASTTLEVVSGSNYGITLAGNWNNSGTFNEQKGMVTFDGSGTQTIRNESGETFYNLKVNNSAASNNISLNNNIIIEGTLTLTDGILNSGSPGKVVFSTTGNAIGASDASFLSGPVIKNTNSTTKFDFLLGEITQQQTISIIPETNTSSSFQIQYFRSEQANGINMGTGIDHVSSLDFCTIERLTGSTNIKVVLSWDWDSEPEIDNLGELRVCQWKGTSWNDAGNYSTSGDFLRGTIASNIITSFSSTNKYFSIGSSTSNNALSNKRYFVGATNSYWDTNNAWSYQSGGTGGATPPTSTKTVFVENGKTIKISDATTAQASISVAKLIINGSLSLENNQSRNININVGSGGLKIGNNGNISGGDNGDNITVSGNVTLNNSMAMGHSNLILSFGTSGVTINGNGNISRINNNKLGTRNTGNLKVGIINSSFAWSNEGTISVTNRFSGNGKLTNKAGSTFDFNGTTFNGKLDATAVNNTLRISNKTGNQMNLSLGIFGNEVNNLIVGGTSGVTFGNALIITGDLTIEAGAILDNASNNRLLNLGGNWINNNGEDGFLEGSNTITFDGNNAQNIAISSGNEVFEKLTINNTSSTGVTLTKGEVHINNTLTLTDGIIYTDATNMLVLEDGIANVSGSVASFIDGPVKKIGDDSFIFPVGDENTWARLGIESLSNFGNDTEFICQYFKNSYSNTSTLNTDLSGVSTVEYWDLKRTFDAGNDASCKVRLFWENASNSRIDDINDLRVVHYYNPGTGLKWYNSGYVIKDNGDGSGEILSELVFSSFSPISFGSEFGFAPLPVELSKFQGRVSLKDHKILLNWETATEINNDYFEVQRSIDGIHFKLLGMIKGNGNRNYSTVYGFEDKNPINGNSYYRLKQFDFDGKYSFSKVIQIKYEGFSKEDLVIYPNPSNGVSFNLLFVNRNIAKCKIQIFNSEGKLVIAKNTKPQLHNKIINLKFETPLRSGFYFVKVTLENQILFKRLIIK